MRTWRFRKKNINDVIIQNVDEQREVNLNFPLYRGIVIKDDGKYDKMSLLKKIDSFKIGSYSSDRNIAEAYSRCGYNGNLDFICSNYYSVLIKFVDGNYVNIHNMLNPEDMFEKYYIREKEYYCFAERITIVDLAHYGSNHDSKKLVEQMFSFIK